MAVVKNMKWFNRRVESSSSRGFIAASRLLHRVPYFPCGRHDTQTGSLNSNVVTTAQDDVGPPPLTLAVVLVVVGDYVVAGRTESLTR
ncbi:unnamed protein product [Soboliphyme baturini]|uniref:Uncharacterized protein n=1 Tax=Soboliphyme baturini TaxID=241478 RepID=A0A183J8K3_9BILA|nr:unnamed protein product [Soboliphyme baturini]